MSPSLPEAEVVKDPMVTKAQASYNALASAFSSINSRYRITLECADLLIELGGGNTNLNSSSIPSTSSLAPLVFQSTAVEQGSIGPKRGRERAITLAGDESKNPPVMSSGRSEPILSGRDAPVADTPPISPPGMSWRASTGRHDLSQRQLVLLREMLNNMNVHATLATENHSHPHSHGDSITPEESLHVPSDVHAHPRSLQVGVNREWKWGDARNSTITLPSEDSVGFDGSGKTSAEKKRRSGKLGMMGMIGLRDLLRALKRSAIEGDVEGEMNVTPAVPDLPIHSSTSLSTESSAGSKLLQKLPQRQPSQHRRRPKTGLAPESVRSTRRTDKELESDPDGLNELRPRSPCGPDSFTPAKPAPRRPSLASIFRIGRNRPVNNVDTAGVCPNPSSQEVAEDDLRAQSSGTGEDSSAGEEDWDRMDSASVLDAVAKGLSVTDGSATVRGGSRREGKKKKAPCLQHVSFHPPPPPLISSQSLGPVIVTKRSFSASQPSIRGIELQSVERLHSSPSNPSRFTCLSFVEEHVNDVGSSLCPPTSMRTASETYPKALTGNNLSLFAQSHTDTTKTGSTRSVPPPQISPMSPLSDSGLALAMTPENIKPLLENAKEVQSKLSDCIAEIRALVDQNTDNGDGSGTVPLVDVTSA